VNDGELLASAMRYDLVGSFDGRRVNVAGIGRVSTDPAHHGRGYEQALVEHLIDQAAVTGADAVLTFRRSHAAWYEAAGFTAIPTTDVVLDVAQSRRGAPMTLIRGGEARDLAAVVAMGTTRAQPFTFHLERDVEFVQHAITRKRLLAGLGAPGARELHFVIAEEGTTAAAYVVCSVVRDTWTIEECGDRDPGGARVGAILQALIARAPSERRPVIRGWLPGGFVPPQVTIAATKPSVDVLMIRHLRMPAFEPPSNATSLYWRGDVF
jgi:hypothetical protein